MPEVDGEQQPVDTSRCMVSGAKVSSETEPAFKKPRIETPSPMPTFKVINNRFTAIIEWNIGKTYKSICILVIFIG